MFTDEDPRNKVEGNRCNIIVLGIASDSVHFPLNKILIIMNQEILLPMNNR